VHSTADRCALSVWLAAHLLSQLEIYENGATSGKRMRTLSRAIE
jgi:hypothetical protein